MLVGEATRRATEQTVAYEDAGAHELKGKAGPTPLWRALRVVSGRARHAQVGRARGAVRRPRPRAAPDQGALPRVRRREQGAPRLGHRHRRDRQVAPGVGVLQVLRRHRPDHVLAPRPLPLLRRGRHLLGAGRHGAHALPDRRGGRARRRAREAASALEEHIPDPEERAFVEPRLAQLLGPRRARGRRQAGPVRRLAALLRAPRRRLPDRARRSRTCSGRTRACSTSSSTCSSGRRNSPIFVVTLARPELAERRPGVGRRPPQLHLALPRAAARRRRWRSSSTGLVPGLPETVRGADPRPRRGRAAVRSRDGADAARPRPARPGGPGLPAGRARSASSRCRRRCTR